MLHGFFDPPWWAALLVALALTHITIAAVTIFLHRQQSHHALELGALPSHFFRFWLWLTTGMITKEWVAIHRKHHAKCETSEDPHSPRVLGLPRVLFGGVFLYVRESRKRETIARYGHGTPADWLERHIYTPLHKLGIVLMLAIDLALFGPLFGALVWALQMLWIPFWAAGVINGVGHYWGYRSFACADASTNIVPWGILIGGEELHNNHHAYVGSAKLANKWFEFDIGWFYIRILAALRLARVKKVAPPLHLAARPGIDLETLHAVITHRYEVLARFIKSMQRVAADECARMKIDAREGRQLKRLLQHKRDALPLLQREALGKLLARSVQLAKIYAMGAELEALWARSSASRAQLLEQFRDWTRRAESSGIRQLEEFSRRLQRYAV